MQAKPRKPVIINQKGTIPKARKLPVSPEQRSMQRRQPHREVIRCLPIFNGLPHHQRGVGVMVSTRSLSASTSHTRARNRILNEPQCCAVNREVSCSEATF